MTIKIGGLEFERIKLKCEDCVNSKTYTIDTHFNDSENELPVVVTCNILKGADCSRDGTWRYFKPKHQFISEEEMKL